MLARRLGLKRLLWLAAVGCGLSGAPLNGYPPVFFPRHPHTAVVALHTLLGLGLAVGPLLAGRFTDGGIWVGFPLAVCVLSALLMAAAVMASLPREDLAKNPGPLVDRKPPLKSAPFWVFAGVAMAYAFAEGTFSNWAVIYLYEAKRLSEAVAALALSIFWAAMVAGRLIVSGLVVRIAPQAIWMALPVLMIAAFLLLPFADTAPLGLGLFALAGLACSAFFPLTITLVSERFPEHVTWVSSMMIAALMVGVGLGSFVIGPLRDWLAFEQLYRLSALYPALALGMAVWLVTSKRTRVVAV